jgi:hypothetical protein
MGGKKLESPSPFMSRVAEEEKEQFRQDWLELDRHDLMRKPYLRNSGEKRPFERWSYLVRYAESIGCSWGERMCLVLKA